MNPEWIVAAFHFPGILVLPIAAVLAFVLGSIVGGVKGEGAVAMLRGLEAALLAAIGALLASVFTGLLLMLMGVETGPRLFIGWGFFLWPGAVDSGPAIFGKGPYATAPDVLLWFARVVGAFAGMLDGIWKIHRWKGPGVATFLLDYTWGLAGTLNGCLFHLINFAWAGHANTSADERQGAHAYARGFAFKSGFAVTQGCVMSNMSGYGPGSTLFRHENVHVWQNRAFGPFFTLTYLGWMAVMLIPAMIASAITKTAVGDGIQAWCYWSNPWEAWAYAAAGQNRSGTMVWGGVAVVIGSVIFFGAVVALAVWGGIALWR